MGIWYLLKSLLLLPVHILLFTAQLRVEPEDAHSCSQLPSWTLPVLTCQQRLCSDTKTKDDKGCICKKSNPVSHMPTPIHYSLNKVINTFPCYISIISHYINGSLSCNYYCVSMKNLCPSAQFNFCQWENHLLQSEFQTP